MGKRKRVCMMLAAVLLLANMSGMTVFAEDTGGRSSVAEIEHKAMKNITNDILNSLDEAERTGAATVTIDGVLYGINTLSRDMMLKIHDAGVDVIFSYHYKGNHYVITIPAEKAVVDEDIPWCGPLYLAGTFYENAVIEPIQADS